MEIIHLKGRQSREDLTAAASSNSENLGFLQLEPKNHNFVKRANPKASVKQLKTGRNFTFQHQNDLKHTFKSTKEWQDRGSGMSRGPVRYQDQIQQNICKVT